MEFITNLFSRSTITEIPKLEINTLDTSFTVNENALEIYQNLLNYSLRNTSKQNDYKTTVKLINFNKTFYFSTYSKII